MTQLTAPTQDIVAKLWNLCNVLRDDGVTYQDYVTELTYLLFLKMLEETDKDSLLPREHRWRDLVKLDGEELLTQYRRILVNLGDPKNPQVKSERVHSIFADAQTSLRKPANLRALVESIDRLDWFSAREEGLGNLYEGLLEKNASEKKSGAGQYFTPRPLIDCIVRLVKPKPGEIIQDPAVGTGGFLVAADQYIKGKTDDLYQLSEEEQIFQRTEAFVGLELVPDTHRLCLMNLMLHGIDGGVKCGDTLSPDGLNLGKADLILTNPPFGTKKGGGRPNRQDFSITVHSSNKQLAFVEHIYRSLKPRGRAAVVVPDNVLFEDNAGVNLRKQLMELCNLHTILRLPTGIFYSQGVKTNVIFFTRNSSIKEITEEVWVYDLRTNMPQFGKRTSLSHETFSDFEQAFGSDPFGDADKLSLRKDTGMSGRFRRFSRDFIEDRNFNLDITWLKENSTDVSAGPEDPKEIIDYAVSEFETAVSELKSVLSELYPEAK
ncbi:MAG: N-6 DNA methylase [Cyanobacteria bacterium HKST-UBA01]|nr:N-6 DNA methylase [Cyanobacteria bacterium HKST-UBA01]